MEEYDTDKWIWVHNTSLFFSAYNTVFLNCANAPFSFGPVLGSNSARDWLILLCTLQRKSEFILFCVDVEKSVWKCIILIWKQTNKHR